MKYLITFLFAMAISLSYSQNALRWLDEDRKLFRELVITIGDKPSWGDGPGGRSTTIWGNNSFYNTLTTYPLSFKSSGPRANDLTEPCWFIQADYKLKGNNWVGAIVNKEKFRSNDEGFGYAGPTNLGFSYGKEYDSFDKKWIASSTNISASAGIVLGRPRIDGWVVWFTSGTDTIGPPPSPRYVNFPYKHIGWFGSVVVRQDLTFFKHVNIFVAGTGSYRRIMTYENTGVGVQKGFNIWSVAINVGAGFRILNKK
jgi:hypothetical protein